MLKLACITAYHEEELIAVVIKKENPDDIYEARNGLRKLSNSVWQF